MFYFVVFTINSACFKMPGWYVYYIPLVLLDPAVLCELLWGTEATGLTLAIRTSSRSFFRRANFSRRLLCFDFRACMSLQVSEDIVLVKRCEKCLKSLKIPVTLLSFTNFWRLRNILSLQKVAQRRHSEYREYSRVAEFCACKGAHYPGIYHYHWAIFLPLYLTE